MGTMTTTPQQQAIRDAANALLETLEASVPGSTLHYAVEQAKISAATLARLADGVATHDAKGAASCILHGERGIECGPECARLTASWNGEG